MEKENLHDADMVVVSRKKILMAELIFSFIFIFALINMLNLASLIGANTRAIQANTQTIQTLEQEHKALAATNTQALTQAPAQTAPAPQQ
ncbi:hypothetical protein [Heliophilum fasciatum]|uniref:Uncharacterized protein n=1 Tax=Heliophilum fasciatum TaxID=35700 RepID=A0A4R2RQ10_9FIRM|nr:hypothetical protein [Heliophilum fasciatum]MCW2277541.1 cell division protein FtsB [Heliophilum fasciatum]TCP65168.1 hypothetical protein EDD73_10651 [Heliophilum fasciatum]